jgi:hypothetical protein
MIGSGVLRIVLRILKWAVISAVGLVVLILGCWLLLPDEALDPAVVKTLAVPPPPAPDRNGYFLLWGLLASSELDPHEAGQKIVAEHERLLAGGGDVGKFDTTKLLGAHPLTISASRKRCDAETVKCLPYYLVTQADYKKDIAAHALQLERYRALRGYPQYAERVMTLNVNSPLPKYSTFMTLSDFTDAGIAFKMANAGTRVQALDELAAEIDLWRRIARDSDTLINQMIAVNILQRKYHLASEVLNTYPELVRKEAAKIAAISAPIPLNELTLERPMQGEFRFVADLYRNLERAATAASTHVEFNEKLQGALLTIGAYKPNASINQAYARFRDSTQLAAKSPKEVVEGRAALMARYGAPKPWMPNVMLYNPIGRGLDAEAAVDFSQYAFRLFDLVGLTRLVELQRRAIEARAPTGRLPGDPLNKENLTNPYTGQPMDWDVAKNTISFPGFGGRNLKEGRVVVEVREP